MEKSITPFVYRGPVILAPQKMGDVQASKLHEVQWEPAFFCEVVESFWGLSPKIPYRAAPVKDADETG